MTGALLVLGTVLDAGQPMPAGIFRVSANGATKDAAMKDATALIGRVCSADTYVIVGDTIRLADNGAFYYGAVSARCGTATTPDNAPPLTLAKL